MLRSALVAVGGISVGPLLARGDDAATGACRGDLAIDESTALLFPQEAALVPAPGLRDARAVWSGVPRHPDGSVLLFLHGYNGYVTVDAKGRSRVPDWAAADAKGREGASSKPAAPLVYELDRLESRKTGKAPIVLVPEVSTLATGTFWAKEPVGQYADPARLGSLVTDCVKHLACLRRRNDAPYLSDAFMKGRLTDRGARLNRIYLSGHSGAGVPLEEAARSTLALPGAGVPTDLWLFDCTYWSLVAGFVRFCTRWHSAGRLAGGRPDASRLVCVYRPKTQTEAIADTLRGEIAKALGMDPASLVKDHTADNFETEVRPALETSGVLFVRSDVPHDNIPTFFIPALLQTAASHSVQRARSEPGTP